MKTLFILNDPPYGTERCYNALRLAYTLLSKDEVSEVVVFLMADAVVGARKGQKTPNGYYNIERMLKRLVGSEGRVLLCSSCMDARGMTDEDIVEGARRSSMDELANETVLADKVLIF
jgi:uncharacterized protein involved in oxidation of intracellular sulfur